MAGELIPASEADRIGLVNHVVPAAELMPRALAYARKLADGAQLAIRWTKLAVNKLILQQLNLTLELGLATEFMCTDDRGQQGGLRGLPREAQAGLPRSLIAKPVTRGSDRGGQTNDVCPPYDFVT